MNVQIFETYEDAVKSFNIDVRNLNITPNDYFTVNCDRLIHSVNGCEVRYIVIETPMQLYKLKGLDINLYSVFYFKNQSLRNTIVEYLRAHVRYNSKPNNTGKIILNGKQNVMLEINGVTIKGKLKGELEII